MRATAAVFALQKSGRSSSMGFIGLGKDSDLILSFVPLQDICLI